MKVCNSCIIIVLLLWGISASHGSSVFGILYHTASKYPVLVLRDVFKARCLPLDSDLEQSYTNMMEHGHPSW